jgi:hypothetical protein
MVSFGRPVNILLAGTALVGGWALLTGTPIATVLRMTDRSVQVAVDRVPDLTAGAFPMVQPKGQDRTGKAELYEIRVKNMTAGPLSADSLVIVLDRITDNRTGEDVLGTFEVLEPTGLTADGKAYFRVPSGGQSLLASSDETSPIQVKIRNHAEIQFFTPSFRVREAHRLTVASPASGSQLIRTATAH